MVTNGKFDLDYETMSVNDEVVVVSIEFLNPESELHEPAYVVVSLDDPLDKWIPSIIKRAVSVEIDWVHEKDMVLEQISLDNQIMHYQAFLGWDWFAGSRKKEYEVLTAVEEPSAEDYLRLYYLVDQKDWVAAFRTCPNEKHRYRLLKMFVYVGDVHALVNQSLTVKCPSVISEKRWSDGGF